MKNLSEVKRSEVFTDRVSEKTEQMGIGNIVTLCQSGLYCSQLKRN